MAELVGCVLLLITIWRVYILRDQIKKLREEKETSDEMIQFILQQSGIKYPQEYKRRR